MRRITRCEHPSSVTRSFCEFPRHDPDVRLDSIVVRHLDNARSSTKKAVGRCAEPGLLSAATPCRRTAFEKSLLPRCRPPAPELCALRVSAAWPGRGAGPYWSTIYRDMGNG